MSRPLMANAQEHAWDKSAPRIHQRDVHLWNWSLDDVGYCQLSWLDKDERRRHAALATPALQRAFLSAHAAARCILASYMKCEPAAVQFVQAPGGKPSVISATPQFNLSHSGCQALLAVSHHAVGVDIERVRPIDHLDKLIEKHLSPSEIELLAEMPEQERHIAFFRYWTGKEAVAKLVGIGLRADVKRLHLGKLMSGPRKVSIPSGWSSATSACWLEEGEMSGDFAASLASFEPIRNTLLYKLRSE